jgi:O-antigen/teichoic acid export membrane protein
MFPAFAELEGAEDRDRQRRLLLTGLRAGMALMLVLALPLLLIPDLLIHAWIGGGFRGSYSVMAILAGVLLVHQPIFVVTQFLIARGRQRAIAIISIAVTVANLALSFLLASIVGLWGVAVSTLATDLAMLAVVLPWIVAPAAGTTTGVFVRSILRPFAPAFAAAVVVLVGLGRWWAPDTLVSLAPLGALWLVVATAAIWRFGLAEGERAQFGREFLQRRPVAAAEL